MKRLVPARLRYLLLPDIEKFSVGYKKQLWYPETIKRSIAQVKQQAKEQLSACGYRIPPIINVTVEDKEVIAHGTAMAINPMVKAATPFRYTQRINVYV